MTQLPAATDEVVLGAWETDGGHVIRSARIIT